MYPGIWIVTLIMPGEPLYWSGAGAVHLLLYPTLFTFVALILPAYPVFFVLVRSPRFRSRLGTLSALLVLTGCLVAWRQTSHMNTTGVPWGDVTKLAWMPHYLGAMFLGARLAFQGSAAEARGSLARLAFLSAGVYAIYLSLRLAGTPMLSVRLGHGAQTVGLLAMPMVLVVVAMWWRFFDLPRVSAALGKGILGTAVAFLAANTWETYMVHKGVAYWNFVHAVPRPLGVALVFMGTLALAPVLGRITAALFPSETRKQSPTGR